MNPTVAMVSPVQLLREGYFSLQNNKCGVALRSFQQCMMLASQSPKEYAPSQILRNANPTNGPLVQAYPLGLTQLSETVSPHNLFLVFDRVFLTQDVPVPEEITSTACVYNIALTHHVRALTCVHESTLNFQRARHFYRLALQAAEACIDMEDPEDPLLPMVLAILNNVGHIHCHFAQAKEMKAIFDSICRLLPRIFGHRAMDERDLIFFCSFKCLVNLSMLQGAAAA